MQEAAAAIQIHKGKKKKKKQLQAANSAEEISVEAATVLSEVDDILILKEKQRTLSSV